MALSSANAQSTFEIVEGNFTWEQAKADAEARGGRLAVLNTQEKIDTAKSYLEELGSWPNLWIGLTDKEVEGQWEWVTGESLAIDDWAAPEPNSGRNENYACIIESSHSNQGWHDAGDWEFSYLIEIPVTFQIVEGNFTWEQAKADAEAKGGRLAVLNSQEKIDQANDYLASFDREIQPWIGLTDREEEGVWKWINGESYTIDRSDWLPGEPDNSPDSDGVYITDKFKFGDHPSDLNAYLLELHNGFAPTLNDGLVAYYPFNGNADDESGNGNNGTAEGATLTTDRNGNAGSAFNFNGSSIIRISDSDSLDLEEAEPATFSVWVNVAVQNRGHIFGKRRGDTTNYMLDLVNGGRPMFRGYTHKGIEGDEPLPINQWIHLACTWDGTTCRLFIDGELSKEGSDTPIRGPDDHDFVIGGTGAGHTKFKGKIDELRIYNRALSESEVAELHEPEKSKEADWSQSTFSLVQGTFGWKEAKLDAESRGGRLAVVNTPEKNEIAAKLAKSLFLDTDGNRGWIGLTDEEVEGQWKWIDGTPLQWSNWYPGNPSTIANENYATYWVGSSWSDNADATIPGFEHHKWSYILEMPAADKPLDPDPSPPVLTLEEFYEALPDETITIDATPESGFPDDFTYQWYFGTFLIPELLGGKESSRTISANEDNNGLWKVVVANSEGSAESIFNFSYHSVIQMICL